MKTKSGVVMQSLPSLDIFENWPHEASVRDNAADSSFGLIWIVMTSHDHFGPSLWQISNTVAAMRAAFQALTCIQANKQTNKPKLFRNPTTAQVKWIPMFSDLSDKDQNKV